MHSLVTDDFHSSFAHDMYPEKSNILVVISFLKLFLERMISSSFKNSTDFARLISIPAVMLYSHTILYKYLNLATVCVEIYLYTYTYTCIEISIDIRIYYL